MFGLIETPQGLACLIIATPLFFGKVLDILSADGTGGVDLTGYTANSHLRKHTDSGLSAVITVGITSAADGKLSLSLTDAQTAGLTPGRHVYDVLLTKPSGGKLIAVEGTALVRPGISTGPFS